MRFFRHLQTLRRSALTAAGIAQLWEGNACRVSAYWNEVADRRARLECSLK
ncbi:MAG: hypothetical protein OJF48_004452 [Afipia sp.]|jgi:hypothetical protein|nr:MAG: hypothetical protein OJF48_004452 [Afipia sp.]